MNTRRRVRGGHVRRLARVAFVTLAHRPSAAAYVLQVGFTDRVIGLLLDKLEAAGLYDRALIVVTADHGMSFRSDAPPRIVTDANVADIAAVPLFVKYPGDSVEVEWIAATRRRSTCFRRLPTSSACGCRGPSTACRHFVVRRSRGVSRSRGTTDPRLQRTLTRLQREFSRPLAGIADLFGDRTDSLYRIGPNKELLGRAVAPLTDSGSDDVRVRLDDAELFADVRTSSLFVPARVMGSITGMRIQTALRWRSPSTVGLPRRRGFSHCGERDDLPPSVPENVFVDGRNVVQVYAVDSSEPYLQVRLLGGTAPRGRLLGS